jgi:shikimate 5-dehydrogenase
VSLIVWTKRRNSCTTGRDALSAGCNGCAGLEILSGYELFFYQGVDAFEAFTGLRGTKHRFAQH